MNVRKKVYDEPEMIKYLVTSSGGQSALFHFLSKSKDSFGQIVDQYK